MALFLFIAKLFIIFLLIFMLLRLEERFFFTFYLLKILGLWDYHLIYLHIVIIVVCEFSLYLFWLFKRVLLLLIFLLDRGKLQFCWDIIFSNQSFGYLFQQGILVRYFWGDFFLLNNQGFVSIFDHMFSSLLT